MGASVYTGSPQHVTLYPIGPGAPRIIFLPELEHIVNESAYFLPGGKQIVVDGNLPGQADREFLVNLTDSKPKAQPMTRENEFVDHPSPDGKYAIESLGNGLGLFPLDGGKLKPIPLPPLTSGRYDVVSWSADGKALYVYREGELPMTVYRAEIATGKLTAVQTLTPADRAGVTAITCVTTTTDASEFAYSYYQVLSSLYVITGLH